MNEILNHLWQCTLFSALAAFAAIAFRNNKAKTRYWIWMAASIKFLIPFSLLLSLGSKVDTSSAAPIVTAMTVQRLSTSFAPVEILASSRHDSSIRWWPKVLVAVWLLGTSALLLRWFRRWLVIRQALHGAVRLPISAPIPVHSSLVSIEPGVFGILRPVLLLPDGISDKLSEAELDAILAHELTHVRRRDNLTGALHMAVEAVFWFHPSVWWIGARLVEERERACDEAVIEGGNRPEVYAQGIVNVCKHYFESPLLCASGVSGADLRKRIEGILSGRTGHRLNTERKLLIGTAAILILAAPVAIGILRAQTLTPSPIHRYDVATIRPSRAADQSSRLGPGPQGGLRAQNVTVMQLLRFAYDRQDFQFASAPGWVTSSRFDVMFTPDQAETAAAPNLPRAEFNSLMNRQRQRLQAVLEDRFQLVLRTEKKDQNFFALTAAKGGHKLKPAGEGGPPQMQTRPGLVTAKNVHLSDLTRRLASFFGREVTDETGLTGSFDFTMQWTANEESTEASEADRSAIVTALTEQLGLKLESRKGPIPVLVIEKIEKPSEN